MSLPRSLLVTAFAVSLLLTGCGSKQGAAPSTAPSAPTVSKDDALAAGVPEAIRSAGKLRVGSNIQNPPNNFYAEDGKTPIGSEVDLMKAIAARLGLTVEYSDMAFSSLITSLESGRVDVIMAAMNDTPERQQKIDFVDYLAAEMSLMVQKGNPKSVRSPDDLCGKGVAVNLGSTQETWVKSVSQSCTQKGKSEVTLTVTDSDTQNQSQLRTGRVDVIINDLPTAAHLAKTAGDGKFFEVVKGFEISSGVYGIGVNKQNQQLSKSVKAALESLKSDGTYRKILETWEVQAAEIDAVTINGK